MTEPWQADRARAAVVEGVQNLAAARLGRGFVPLALLFLFGAVQTLREGPLAADYLFLALGALAAGGAMLAYGLRAVRLALGSATARWVAGAGAAGLVPYLFGLYVLAFRGLRPLAGLVSAFEPTTLVAGLIFIVLSLRVLWIQNKLTELQRLARTMTMALPGEEGGAP